MRTPETCAECGGFLHSEVSPGFCPACATHGPLAVGGVPAEAPLGWRPEDRFGSFQMPGRVAEGGFSVDLLASPSGAGRKMLDLVDRQPHLASYSNCPLYQKAQR